ncbi:hypothetical protein HPB49_018751 [Dermacentor silvarum]|uniref:Uncharacterized protein n=1 Tax=Dermacentor silvarum TaxID=543639 RepID=A0ACB8CZC5_DERSI|nr:elongation of very long chain fatty acids protein 7 [Dermacentor silvarum]KAH7954451.1 hypothetical protein HPB49_018751 [Dermacentor silvarum]
MASKSDFDPAVHWFPELDSRTRGWPLVGNPIPLIAICVLYVYVVKIVGPKWMADRKPFELRALMAVYNLALVLLNSFFVWTFVRHGYIAKGYKIVGQGVDFSTDPLTMHIVHLTWWYYVLRLVEFLDTVFFVMRKKYAQVTALHVFHHVVVAWNMWMNVTFGGQGQTMFVTVVNSSVHVVMYTYYFLSALGPAFQRYIWWKRYLTQMQLTQFMTVFLHSLSYLLYKEDAIPGFTLVMVLEAVVFLLWFLSFYSNAYRKGGRSTLDMVTNTAVAAKEALAKVATSCCPESLDENKDE